MKKNLLTSILFSIVLFSSSLVPAQSAETTTGSQAVPCTSDISFCIERFSPIASFVGFTVTNLSEEATTYAWYIGMVTGLPIATESTCFVPSASLGGRAVIVVITDENGCTKTLTGPTANNTTVCTL